MTEFVNPGTGLFEPFRRFYGVTNLAYSAILLGHHDNYLSSKNPFRGVESANRFKKEFDDEYEKFTTLIRRVLESPDAIDYIAEKTERFISSDPRPRMCQILIDNVIY